MVLASHIVFPALARTAEKAAETTLSKLDIEIVAMERDLPRHSDAGLIDADVVGTLLQAKFLGRDGSQFPAHLEELILSLWVVPDILTADSDVLVEIELDCGGHGGLLVPHQPSSSIKSGLQLDNFFVFEKLDEFSGREVQLTLVMLELIPYLADLILDPHNVFDGFEYIHLREGL